MRHFTFLFAFLLLAVACQKQPTIIADPDDLDKAYEVLASRRAEALQAANRAEYPPADLLDELIDLGLWEEAEIRIKNHPAPDHNIRMVEARLKWMNNDFFAAEAIMNQVLAEDPKHFKALLMKSVLEVEAWELDKAAETALNLAKNSKGKEEIDAMLQYGRVLIWKKEYDKALKIARDYQKKDPSNAKAYLLEADVFFWDQKPEEAERPLKRTLEINPLIADARYSYGYAIWRRVDAEQLKDMASQWEFALTLNPLHYYTHWHWGNGHTQLTYADYAAPDDDEVREKLKKADDLARENKAQEAIAYTFNVQSEHPASVIPLLHRASLYYVAYDLDRQLRLDSAQMLFQKILSMKTNYGPAHNGLSAVIKSKRIPYLAAYDSIDNALRTMVIKDEESFARVFPDVTYYPGDMVKMMVYGQMYNSIAYFPFLSKLSRQFRVPPLHIDLSIAMNNPFFRFGTTFDNRQWMDIRGVGSGAAAIEYVERGAFLERNVVLHEFVHLFHGQILTDEENREIRKRYFTAMKEGRTLDYYSSNNESEYFAQTYPAFFEPVKVHPLDFKSMNTTNDLYTKDPEMYAFLKKLTDKEQAYLDGNVQAMASNWSEVYVKLSSQNRANTALSRAYLDTALIWDGQYLPAYLSYASLHSGQGNHDEAKNWLDKAAAINPNYAPIHTARASWYASLASAGKMDAGEAVEKQIEELRTAIQKETDFQVYAGMSGQLRSLLRDYSRIPEAIESAMEYANTAETISTYLRDRRDDALMFAWFHMAEAGDGSVLPQMDEMVRKKPQNYGFRTQYADALAAHGQFEKALSVLEEAQRILAASGNPRADFSLRMADYYLSLGNSSEALSILEEGFESRTSLRSEMSRVLAVLSKAGLTDRAAKVMQSMRMSSQPYDAAHQQYAMYQYFKATGNQEEAEKAFEKAQSLNPHLPFVK